MSYEQRHTRLVTNLRSLGITLVTMFRRIMALSRQSPLVMKLIKWPHTFCVKKCACFRNIYINTHCPVVYELCTLASHLIVREGLLNFVYELARDPRLAVETGDILDVKQARESSGLRTTFRYSLALGYGMPSASNLKKKS